MSDESMTIGKLARSAAVNIETVRYYQARKLLPVPKRAAGAFRYYPVALVERIGFIKRAQELGFSLEEIRELLRLHDGTDRVSIRRIAGRRLEQIEAKLNDLSRMRMALSGLMEACEKGTPDAPCPVIKALAAGRQPIPARQTRR